MKKILVVLALLIVCSMAFSVTGTVQVRLLSSGQPAITEWGGTLNDIVIAGRHDTYAAINFDNFGFLYAPRDSIALPTGITENYGQATAYSGGGLVATSPGYFEINGLKLGNMSLTVGASIWTFGESGSMLDTNANGTTNVQGAITAGYTRFAFAGFFQLPIGDTIKIQGQPWDRLWIEIASGSMSLQGAGVTNAGANAYFKFYFPLYIDMTLDKLSLELFPKIDVQANADVDSTVSTTNTYAQGQTLMGVLVRASYPINDQFSVMGHVGLESWATVNDSYKATLAGTATNIDELGQFFVPIFAGIIWSPASWFSMNLGFGYLMLASSTETIIVNGATNIIHAGGGLQGQYNNDDLEEHYYNVPPFASLGGSAKFASDWELGFKEVVSLNVPNGAFGTQTGYYVNKQYTYGYSTASQLLHWDTQWNFDGGGGTCYLKYSKDNVTFKGVFGGGSDLIGLFQYIEMSINF